MWKWDIKKQKTEKWVVKTIKCIYSEPGILILSGVPFNFYLINLFQTVLGQRTTISLLPPTRLSLDAIRVPGSAFYFVSSLAFMVGYLFVNASQGVGDEIVVTQIVLVFIWVSGLFRANFSKPPHRGCPTPKRAKKRSFCMYSALVVAAHSLFRNIGLKSYWSLC